MNDKKYNIAMLMTIEDAAAKALAKHKGEIDLDGQAAAKVKNARNKLK